jgi:hypothetical protein
MIEDRKEKNRNKNGRKEGNRNVKNQKIQQ